MIQSVPNNLAAKLCDTRAKRIHLVLSLAFLALVEIGMIRTFIVEREETILGILGSTLLMALSIAASLFAMKYVETRAPALKRIAYLFVPVASFFGIFWLRWENRMWWRNDLSWYVAEYAVLFCTVGIAMLLVIPLIRIWAWIVEV